MDPPYASPLINTIIEQLANSKIVGNDSVLVVTHSKRRPLETDYASLHLFKEHRHGDSAIAFFRKEPVS
jgi:16S rRNA G966 N2-methylase RsmD